MPVYVDDMLMSAQVGRIKSRWSHMFADTTEELNSFAVRLGLKKAWIQYPGTHREHYDLTESKRELALKLGAISLPIKSPEWKALRDRKREEHLKKKNVVSEPETLF